MTNRKGGLEELTTTPDGPPPVAALLRAGHSIGTNVERYIKEMTGGDELCSRVCAGFDLHSPDFSLLPPHFSDEFSTSFCWSTIVPNYVHYPACFKTVIPYLVASVCYQVKTGWLEANFPVCHPFYQSEFWRGRHFQRWIFLRATCFAILRVCEPPVYHTMLPSDNKWAI